MNRLKILVVEDEPKVASFLKQGLEEEGYNVDKANDGESGEKLALKNNYNVILLDVLMPGMTGIELCRKIRSVKPSVPVLMLTALGATDNKLSGFDAGADDYLVKPFEFKELVARVKALTKRGSISEHIHNKIKVADLELDLDKKIAIREEKSIELTAKEFALLEFFMRNQGRVVSRAEIAASVWDITFDTGTNVVDVYVNILRKKIDKDFDVKYIHTRIGMGYMFADEQ